MFVEYFAAVDLNPTGTFNFPRVSNNGKIQQPKNSFVFPMK